MLSTPWLSLSIFNSNMWAASQCLLVSLSGLLEGLIMWVVSPAGPELEFWLVDWARRWPQQPPLVLLQHGGAPISANGSSGRTGCLGWPLPSIGACRVVGQVTFLVNILHSKGSGSPSERSGTPQVVW